MENKYNIQVQVVVFKRQKYWIAYCPALKTYGYSKEDAEDALKDFDNAIDTFLHVQETLGTLNQTLLKLGWKRGNKTIEAPKYFNSDLSNNRGRNSRKRERQISIPA